MAKYETEAREKIMAVAIELIEQHGDTTGFTIREIAAKAGVGMGLINYHFQTKENLINHCIQRMISLVIKQFEPLNQSLEMKPIHKLRYLVRSTAAFLVTNPVISRISILHDLISGSKDDNSTEVAKAYFSVLKQICGDKKTDRELSILLHILISSVQVAFLRRDVLKETIDIDFYEPQSREAFIDMVITSIFAEFSD